MPRTHWAPHSQEIRKQIEGQWIDMELCSRRWGKEGECFDNWQWAMGRDWFPRSRQKKVWVEKRSAKSRRKRTQGMRRASIVPGAVPL